MKRTCMKRIRSKEPSLCLWFFGTNRHSTVFIFAIFLQIFAIFCFQFLFLVRNGEPLFRNQLQYLLIVYTWIWETYISKCYKIFVLVLVRPSVNLCSIYLAEKIRTFKIRFNIKCTGEACICHHFQLFFWDICFVCCLCFVCYRHWAARFCCIFEGLCASQKLPVDFLKLSYM